MYKGTYERATSDRIGSNQDRELRIAWSKDLGRATDYLWTRPDIDRDRLAFYAVSAANGGVILPALESRLKASVLSGAGIVGDVPPEWDALNYVPRVRIPTLMLNGRYDSEAPFETAQCPLFDLLGTPAEHKRHQIFETAHTLRIEDMAGEILPSSTAILDRWCVDQLHRRGEGPAWPERPQGAEAGRARTRGTGRDGAP